jgi:transcriptional regulator with XRE-family HTH domain
VAAPGRDAQLAQIFRNMRAAMRLTRDAIARRLGTTPAVIEDLENGAIHTLPRWPETVRVVRAYCELLRLDPDPILWRIEKLLRGGDDDDVAAAPPVALPLALRNAPVRSRLPARMPRERRRGGGLRGFVLLAMFPAAAAALAYGASQAPAPIYRAIAQLPRGVAGPARVGFDTFVLYSAPRKGGLRWIDVGDPRVRKVDKLRIKRR